MPRWVSVYFDKKRARYHARWRSPHHDRKAKVPDVIFRKVGLDPSRQSERARMVAHRWAVQQEGRIETATLDREFEGRSIRGLFELFKRRNPGAVLQVTMKNYAQRIAHVAEFFDELQLLEPPMIDRDALAAYVRWREDEKVKARTIRGEIALLRQLLSWAMEKPELTGINSIRIGRRLPKIHAEEPSRLALTTDQVSAILDAEIVGRHSDIDRAKRVIVVGITTMLRRSNLLRLRWEWIDINKKWLTIPAKVMKAKRELSIPLSFWTIEMLGTPRAKGFVFPNPVNFGPTKHLRATFDALAAEADAPHFTPHDLRRTGYTWLAERGVERIVRKVLMGHQTGIDVSDLYDRSFRARMAAAVSVFDEIYGNMFPLRTAEVGRELVDQPSN